MNRIMMKSKIHRATVTGADLNYRGSITIDERLMELADLMEHEQVHVVDIDNGARFETYAIPGGPGQVCLNGAAARLVQPGDRIIVISSGRIILCLGTGFEPSRRDGGTGSRARGDRRGCAWWRPPAWSAHRAAAP